MIGWLIYSKEDAIKNKGYIDMYLEKCSAYDMEIKLVYTEDLCIGISDGLPCTNMGRPDFVIVRTIYPLLNQHFETMNIPVFNNSKVSEICNDKARTYQYLSAHGIPILKTWFNKISKEEKQYPLVIKTCEGHGGTEVFWANDKIELDNILGQLTGRKLIIQEAASELGKDLRVYVIGTRIVAAMLRYNPTSFKSNYSLGGSASVYTLSQKETALVEKICSLFNFGLVGIDFVFHNNDIYLNEIEDVVGARMLYANTDIDLVGEYLAYIRSRLT